MRPSDLDDSVLEDLSDLEADLDRINLDSPLHILSPNKLLAEHEGGTNPWKGRPCSAGPLEEENKGGEQRLDDLAAAQHTEDTVPSLPSFSRKKAIDPRRQSTAIFSALKLSSSGAGLLEDSEIALAPDEDILIPLNRSIPFSLTQKSTLWIDPNNEELLDVNLPEPEHFLYEEPQKSPEGQGKEESVQMGRNSENERFKSPPREDIKECCGPSMPSEDAFVDQVVSSKSSKGFLKPSRLRAPSSSSRFFQSSTSQHNSRPYEPSPEKVKRYEEIKTSSSPYKTGSSTKGKSNNMSETWKLPTKIKNSSSKMPRSMARMEIIDSPQSSYYRWLDQNPQLAFQAANKLANSPAVQQVSRKKTAEERHFEAWGPSISALNERKY